MTERDDEHCCFICEQPFKAGEMVLQDITEGLAHRACFGDDREAFVGDVDTGAPLAEGEPLPTGFPYDPAEFAEPAPTAREVSSERVSGERCLEIADGLAAMSEMPVLAQGHRAILLTAAAALRSSVRAVAVKKLEWVAIEAARSDEDPRTEETGDYEAITPFGVYSIEMGFGSDEYVWSLSFDDVLVEGARGGNDPEKLMAAAQSDYERRILSALEAPTPQEAPSEVTEDRVILGAQKVFELFCGKPIDWSAEDIDSPESLLHSADWAQAIAYSRAALKGGK